MAIIKCKMCGGDLNLTEGASTAECEYCGSVQTVPKVDDEKKLTLFARANRLRAACEFDKAAGIYEAIVADFPEEAEAYWGLVLCKYGIEYVDDPATGKKIPTCHRSSFDSVLEDSDFGQAQENADYIAQKVYREEAKTFERIRKGILEVSSTEKPYDIFICYKETDEKGDRTLDSVLAQDLYAALTDKGYRVFFSRITLQGKLGEAYEPYIFAALNSAKVMLAVGTCYEYYNAVWVKNEWSRYLKICAADKTKHLIPCYKDLDPEDMPKEFNHLQGADLGKMGAVQDILFNMEKYIPLKKETTTVIQEKVVVGGSADNKIASLLDRGNMALEDGDWAKADSFFEDVLNNDSKNAQAYLGKTLAQEKCRTIDAFVRKRKEATQAAKTETQYLPQAIAHIRESVKKYAIPDYVAEKDIEALYRFDLRYTSQVVARAQQYREEQAFWADHKLLSRAEKFATGAVAENLAKEKQAVLDTFSGRLEKARDAEKKAKETLQRNYEAHLKLADEHAEKLFREADARREAFYQKLQHTAEVSHSAEELKVTAQQFDRLGDYRDSKRLAEQCRNQARKEHYLKLEKLANTSSDVKTLEDTAAGFISLGDYLNSKALAKHCQQRAAEEREIIRQREKEKQQKEALRKAEERKKKITLISIVSAAVAIVIAVILLVTQVIVPGMHHSEARKLMDAGAYKEAYDYLVKLGDSKSRSMLQEVQEHGTYRVQSVTDQKGQEYTFVYNEKGLLSIVNRDGEIWNKFVYTYYPSGNPETLEIRNDENRLLDRVWFFDTADSDISFTPFKVDYGESEYYPQYEWYLYRGLSKKTTNAWLDEESFVTYDQKGRPISADMGTSNRIINSTVKRWKYKTSDNEISFEVKLDKLGNIKETVRNDVSTGSGSKTITSVEYTYGNKGGSIRSRVIESTGFSSEYSDTAVLGDGGKPVSYTCYDKGASDPSEKLTISWKWVDKKEDAEAIAKLRAEAEQRLASGDYDGAAERYEQIGDFAALGKIALQKAQLLADSGKTKEAAIAFGKLAGTEDATQRSYALWEADHPDTVAVGRAHIVALKKDGTVVASGATDDDRCEVSEWKNIVQVAAANGQTFGLKIDGTVLSTGYNKEKQCDVSEWTDIVAVYADTFHTIGLKADGTVVFAGSNTYGQGNVSNWKNIVKISTCESHTVGLKADGTVVATGDNSFEECNVSGWTDIVAVCAANRYTVGLKADGTVVATGSNEVGSCNVSEWKDITAISIASGLTLGLRSDGTVMVTGDNEYGQRRASEWSGIKEIYSFNGRAVGLAKIGTVASVGYDVDGLCETYNWRNVTKVFGGLFCTVGLQSDGKLVACGDFVLERCACDLSLFTDIKIP